MSDWLIVGLGNPGKRYERTRHNLGFLAVTALARALAGTLTRRSSTEGNASFRMHAKWQAEILTVDTQVEKENMRLHLFLPMTYMNCCGPAIERYRAFYRIPFSHVVILVDDIALPFGQMRFRESGSAGGHNGLKSIAEAFGTQEYPRLRMGIGCPPRSQETNQTGPQDLADYVLSPFLEEEFRQLPDLFHRVIDWVLARPKEKYKVKEQNGLGEKRYE